MKKILVSFLKKSARVSLVLICLFLIGTVALSAVCDYLKYNAPVFFYDSGYEDLDLGEEIITTDSFAHNYAVFVFNRCYRPDARYVDYDLQWLLQDRSNGVWKAVFTDEAVLRAGTEVTLEFAFDGQLIAATGLFERGDSCDYIESREDAKQYGNMLFYHRFKDYIHMLELDSFWLSGEGNQWDMGYFKRGWLGGGHGFVFRSDGKLVKFYITE